LGESYKLTKHLSLNGSSALPPTADIVSEKARPRAHGADLGCPFPVNDHWPDSSDEALNHVGVFQSHLERIDWRYLMDIARPHCESSSRKSLIGGKTS
jgi:hypothetical protein